MGGRGRGSRRGWPWVLVLLPIIIFQGASAMLHLALSVEGPSFGD